MVKEFKEFIARGNLVEIAVAFVMGAAFSSVVTALTTRIVGPLIGLIFSLDGLASVGTFGKAVGEDGIELGSLGAFLQAVLNFLIVGFVMFVIIKAYNAMKTRMAQPTEPAPEPDPEDIVLLREIRDALQK